MLRRLLRDQTGIAVPYVALTIGAIVGMAGLALDVGRLVTTDTQAQAAADAAALAAASQLDRNSDAITRATAAAATVVNQQTYADGGATVDMASIQFLSSLNPRTYTADAAEARFVEVTTEQLTQQNILIQAIDAQNAEVQVQAVAVAGNTQVACRIPPLAICNPNEADPPIGGGIGAPFVEDSWIGKQILVKSGGSNSQWAPGDFGLLDVLGSSQPKDIANMLASANPNSNCYGTAVDIRPGQTTSTRNGLNTRFDMYENPFFGGTAKKDPQFRPAKNITMNWDTAANCKVSENTADGFPQIGMPRDSNLIANPDARLGNGEWDCATYWATNHPSTLAPSGCTASSSMTRWEIYNYENDNGIIPQGPQCHDMAGSLPATEPMDRRTVYFAVINCREHDVKGNAEDVPVESYVEAFLTEPVGNPLNGSCNLSTGSGCTGNDYNVFLEVVDVAEPGGSDGVLHDLVQLYE